MIVSFSPAGNGATGALAGSEESKEVAGGKIGNAGAGEGAAPKPVKGLGSEVAGAFSIGAVTGASSLPIERIFWKGKGMDVGATTGGAGGKSGLSSAPMLWLGNGCGANMPVYAG